MRTSCRTVLACLLVLSATLPARGQAFTPGRNLVVNGGFEEDQDNRRGERMGCPVRQRVTYGQTDGMPDGWTYDAKQGVRVRDSHSGKTALRLGPGRNLALTPTLRPYAVQMKGQGELPPLTFSAWVKGGGTDTLTATLTLSVNENDAKTKKDVPVVIHTVKKEFAVPAQWTQVSFQVPSAEIGEALKKRIQPVGLVTAGLVLHATSDAAGIAIDDVSLLTLETPTPYTLVPNAGFEETTGDGAPAAWSQPKKSLRYFGENYYVWRDWYHFLGVPRGANGIDRFVVRSGKQSYRMNVPPGDDKHIESAAIPLHQKEPRRLVVQFDYNSYLLANLMVQVVNEQGKEVFGQNIRPGSSEGWQTFRAEFLPRKAALKAGAVASAGGDNYGPQGDPIPLEGCRVRIGAKGVNGSEMDDVNEWINVHHAGVLWIDNVALLEIDSTAEDITARGGKTYRLDTQDPEFTAEGIDLGERLSGDNVATVTLNNRTAKPVSGTLTLTLAGPFREDDPKKAGYAVSSAGQVKANPAPPLLPEQKVAVPYSVPANGRMTVELPYHLQTLNGDWRSEYRVTLAFDKDHSCTVPLGTWKVQALVEVEKCYPFVEDKTQTVFMNIGVARKTLAKVDRLRLEVRRARDDQVVLTKDHPDFQKAAATFNYLPLPDGFEGDNTNFFRTEFALDALPVHPQTHPVRDHYVRVVGLDQAGKVVFEGRSPRFGRMEAHTEKLEAIKDVKIHEDNYLLINGKPFFSRGHLWMQQNFGPAPFARQNTDWKRYGFNNRAGVQSPLPESSKEPRYSAGVDDLWTMHNTYVGSQMLAPQGPFTDKTRADIQKWLAKPNVIGLHFVPWEGHPAGKPEEAIKYAADIKAAIGTRPLWISAGWYGPAVSGDLDSWRAVKPQDWFMPENNAYFQPSQLDREILPMKAGKPCVLGTYPNVFNDTPYCVQRFEHWTEIIRHHTGYMQIGKPGDPSLMAGMNGEFRFIESFLFSKEPVPVVTAAPNVEHLVRGTAKATYLMATNAGPVIGGDWQWNSDRKDQGKASHTGDAFWSRFHDYMKDYHSHWYHDGRPFTPKRGDRIVQYVFLPESAKVDCLILMARANGMWRHHAVWGALDHPAFTDSGVRLWMAKDMHQMAWGSIGLGFCGPEGHDPKNPELLKHTFTADQFRRIGDLPKAGAWVRLEVPVEQLGLDGKVVDGFGFVSKGAPVWWKRTLLVRDGKETVLCDGSVGIPPEALRQVRFSVAGLKAGTKIKVCFEERDLIAGDGFFEDDLSGEPGYRNMWVGLYGDKLGETGYYGDGVFYNYNSGKVAARLYEIPR